jgi:hypothetical protein
MSVARLDGNAIAGPLYEAFGHEMTVMAAVCASCGSRAPVAEIVVYLSPMGTVARCRACGRVLIVLVANNGITCVDLGGLAELESVFVSGSG